MKALSQINEENNIIKLAILGGLYNYIKNELKLINASLELWEVVVMMKKMPEL